MVIQSTVGELLAAYGTRLRHVHLHDNKGGGADLHLPLGTGSVDVRGAIRTLQAVGYDGTITLEVFAPDRHYLAYSRDSLQRIWSEEKISGNR
jgi:sugar phosphate isomerase/epimerase